MATRKQIETARAAQSKLMDKVFAEGAPGRADVVFSACLAACSDATRAAYRTAADKVAELEAAAVSSGKAWRGSIGGINFYR